MRAGIFTALISVLVPLAAGCEPKCGLFGGEPCNGICLSERDPCAGDSLLGTCYSGGPQCTPNGWTCVTTYKPCDPMDPEPVCGCYPPSQDMAIADDLSGNDLRALDAGGAD